MPPLEGLSRIFCSQFAKMMDAKCARIVLVLAYTRSYNPQGDPHKHLLLLGGSRCVKSLLQALQDLLPLHMVGSACERGCMLRNLSSCAGWATPAVRPRVVSLTVKEYGHLQVLRVIGRWRRD